MLEVVAGGGSSPHCLLVSVLGMYLCVTTCTGARDPTASTVSTFPGAVRGPEYVRGP